jgi:hypothetical protein
MKKIVRIWTCIAFISSNAMSGAMESEGLPAGLRRRHVGDHRVAWSGANPFSGPIEQPREEHERPEAGERNQNARYRCQRVAAGDQRLSLRHPVRPGASEVLEHRRQSVRGSLDQPDHHRRRAEV